MNSKSFGRHMKLIHRLTQEDLLRHRLEMQTQKMDRLAGNEEPKPIVCNTCGKQFISNVMKEAHDSVCDGALFPGKLSPIIFCYSNHSELARKANERAPKEEAASYEDGDDKYGNIVHL